MIQGDVAAFDRGIDAGEREALEGSSRQRKGPDAIPHQPCSQIMQDPTGQGKDGWLPDSLKANLAEPSRIPPEPGRGAQM